MVFFSDQDGKQGIYNCWPYALFYSFYAASSITIPCLQFKLPITVSYLGYLMLVEPLKSARFTFINTFIVCSEP